MYFMLCYFMFCYVFMYMNATCYKSEMHNICHISYHTIRYNKIQCHNTSVYIICIHCLKNKLQQDIIFFALNVKFVSYNITYYDVR